MLVVMIYQIGAPTRKSLSKSQTVKLNVQVDQQEEPNASNKKDN